MENQIKQLGREIEDYQLELKKLRSELNAFNAVAPQPESSHPADITRAFKAAALATAERVADVKGLKDAIAELEQRLNRKRSQLQELEKQQQHQERLKRIEVGKAEAKSLGDEINSLVSELELKIDQLKTLCCQYEGDDRLLKSKRDFGDYWRPPEFIVFGQMVVPEFLENRGQLTLSTRPIDVFAAEKAEQRKVQSERARQSKAATDAIVAASQKQKIAQEQQRERERIQEILSAKRTELSEAEALHAKYMQQVGRGVKLDLSKIDAFIEATNVEIKQLQDELDLVEKIDDTI